MKIKLGELADIMTGNTPSMKVNEYYDSNDIPFIKPDSFKSHFELKANSYISNRAERKAKIVGANCILVSCIGIIGKVGITSQKVAFNQQINSLNVKPHYDIEYIAYNLLFNKERLQRICNSAVVPLINKTQFSNFEISINKDIIIQRDIKNKLNLLSSIINNNKKKLLLFDDIVKSRFVEMFGDIRERGRFKAKKWKDVLDIFNGKDYKAVQVDKGGYPVYGSGGIIARANDYICPAGTIIIGRKGSINNPILVNEKFWNVDTAFGIVPKEIINISYLYYFCKQYNFNNLNKATTLPSLTKRDLLEIEINIPDLEEQVKFSGFVNQINKLKFD
jgi:hypothetical protein